MWQYTNECLKHEFEGFWNLFVNVSKHELLHLKAEGFLFKMESISALYLEYFSKDNPFKSSKNVILHHKYWVQLSATHKLLYNNLYYIGITNYFSRRIFVVTSVIYTMSI